MASDTEQLAALRQLEESLEQLEKLTLKCWNKKKITGEDDRQFDRLLKESQRLYGRLKDIVGAPVYQIAGRSLNGFQHVLSVPSLSNLLNDQTFAYLWQQCMSGCLSSMRQTIGAAEGAEKREELAVPEVALTARLDSLHPKIVECCRVQFETRQYEDAVFKAMRTVEAELRARTSGDPNDIGVNLVSKALGGKNPPLRVSTVDAEQEAAHLLFRGAIGFFKNPVSHRETDNTDPAKTFEVLAFASLLMRVLDGAWSVTEPSSALAQRPT